MAQYKTSSFVDQVELVAARAARPCVIRTAFGAPVDPDVKIKTQRSSGVHRRPLHRRCGREAVAPRGLRHHEHRGAAEIEPGQQRRTRGVAQHRRAVGVANVARELLAAARVVDPDDDRTNAGGAEEREQVLGLVAHQQPDVERPGSRAQGCERGGPPIALGDDLAPRPSSIVDDEARAVVVRALVEQRGDRGRRHEPPVRSRSSSTRGLPSTGIAGSSPAARVR